MPVLIYATGTGVLTVNILEEMSITEKHRKYDKKFNKKVQEKAEMNMK